jgi:hypothetical protein
VSNAISAKLHCPVSRKELKVFGAKTRILALLIAFANLATYSPNLQELHSEVSYS